MPKLISEAEKLQILDSIYEEGIALIRKKGLRHVTVDDVVHAVGIGKGSFYSYYSTKEEMLFEIVKRAEQKMVDTSLAILNGTENIYKKIELILFQIYLAPDSLIFYVSPADFDFLMRKLPSKYSEFEKLKSTNNFEQFAEILHLKLTPQNYGTISYLMDGLQSIAINPAEYGNEGRQLALKIMVGAITDFMAKEVENSENNDRQ